MRPEKRALVIVIVCVLVIIAAVFTWKMAPVDAETHDAEFTVYSPSTDGDLFGFSLRKFKVIKDNYNDHEYLYYNGTIIERDEK